MTRAILYEMGNVGDEVETIAWAARVHDIGKIALPTALLDKVGELTAEERMRIETHSQRGAEFLLPDDDGARIAGIVRHHHERWDGHGYPDHLAGDRIPLGARVIGVADCFDALTSGRPNRPGLPAARAVRVLLQGRGAQWAPAVVDAFMRHAGEFDDPATQPDSRIVPEPSVSA